jgi:hypothetical protein
MTLETGRIGLGTDDVKDMIHPDRARSDELGRTVDLEGTPSPKPSPREQPAKEVDPLAHDTPASEAGPHADSHGPTA